MKFLHSLFEVTHLEFQTYDLSSHKLVFSSGAIARLLGYSDEEYLNLSKDFSKKIVYPDDRQKVQETIKSIIQSKKGDVIELTVRLLKSDGDYVWVYSRQMIYERNDKKSICTVIREVEDVTTLVDLQNALKEKVEQLKVVSYKNSHLLRSPVASIIGLMDLIEVHRITSDQNRQIFHYLKEAIIKLDKVIHEINDAARVD